MAGIVYLVQPSDCLGSSCYKIGMSKSNTIRRLKDYGNKCINIVSRECLNPNEVEFQLIELFNIHFGAPCKGREWFNGSKHKMIEVFDECFANYAEHNKETHDPEKCKLTFDSVQLYIQNHIEYTQMIYDDSINNKMYDLFNLLPDKWFNTNELITKLIHVLRNEDYQSGTSISTMRTLLLKRSNFYNEILIMKGFMSKMNYRDNRFKLATLTKVVKNEYPDRYDRWMERLKIKKAARSSGFRYKAGALVKLSDLQKNCPNMNAEKLLKLNREYTISQKHLCKSCLNFHKKSCCNMYNRTNRTTSKYVHNIELV